MSTILIVEDELLIALDAEMTLQDAGFEVVGTAATEDDAVTMALEARPDLMVLDLRLADGGCGRRVAERVRTEIKVAIVFASGNLDPAKKRELDPLDPVAMLSKPYDGPELLRAVAAA
ncbi:response regulator [Palleronia rufa]|uniref:response regulator n=1 Tax=Palleronia rufa TaxID=1530186 RepID=UPI000691CF0A|nr:response regulator [Palleronia rufa]